MNRRTRALTATGTVAVLAAGIGIGIALAGGGSKPISPTAAAATANTSAAAFTLNGTFTLEPGAFQWNRGADGNTTCVGRDGYNDITAGAPVVVTDQGGAVIATGALGTGLVSFSSATSRPTQCTFAIAVPSVPARPFYGVTVSHRGTQTYSADQARTGAISLTLG